MTHDVDVSLNPNTIKINHGKEATDVGIVEVKPFGICEKNVNPDQITPKRAV